MMRIAIVGSGSVASAFARAAAAWDGAELVAVCARNELSGGRLAGECGTVWVASPGQAPAADLYIVAVSDSAVGDVAAGIPAASGAVVVHTCGGLDMDVIGRRHPHRGVIYPLQTFSAGRAVDLRQVPLFVEYSDAAACEVVLGAARGLSDNVREADSRMRNRLHIAAVAVNNFANRLYAIAAGILEREGADFSVLAPLIRETVDKALASGDPARMQTGPAARHDGVTIARHLDILRQEGYDSFAEIYKLLSNDIWETSRKI